jgi:hypothetical protein
MAIARRTNGSAQAQNALRGQVRLICLLACDRLKVATWLMERTTVDADPDGEED